MFFSFIYPLKYISHIAYNNEENKCKYTIYNKNLSRKIGWKVPSSEMDLAEYVLSIGIY